MKESNISNSIRHGERIFKALKDISRYLCILIVPKLNISKINQKVRLEILLCIMIRVKIHLILIFKDI